MSPQPDQQMQGRYRSGMIPAGGPPMADPNSKRRYGGTIDNSADQVQGRMVPPWQQAPQGGPDRPIPVQTGAPVDAPTPTPIQALPPDSSVVASLPQQRIPPPWGQPSGSAPSPMGSIPGTGQRAAMSGPQPPASPMSMRQQTQNMQNQGNSKF